MRATLLRTFGMGESTLDDELKDIAASGDVSLGFRTAFPDNYLRPLARAATVEEAEAKLAHVCDAIRERLGPLVYGEGDETLPAVVGRLLREHGRTIAVAESCTGGLVAERITEVPGASDYFAGGVVAYANAAKAALLGVPEAMLAELVFGQAGCLQPSVGELHAAKLDGLAVFGKGADGGHHEVGACQHG